MIEEKEVPQPDPSLVSFQKKTLSDQEWVELARASLIPRSSPVLFYKVATSAPDFPSEKAFRSILSIDFLNNEHLSNSQNPRTLSQNEKLTGEFWLDMVKRYNLKVNDTVGLYRFVFHLVNHDFSAAAENVFLNSGPEELKKFALQKTNIDFSSGYDKKNVIQALVSANHVGPVLQLFSTSPSLVSEVDKKKRSALFSVRNKDMFNCLVKNGIDQSLKNTDNQNAFDFWLELNIPGISSWGFDGGHSGEKALEVRVVNKIFTQNSDMTEEEKKTYERITSDPNWRYHGSVCSLDKEWTLPEIWLWSEAWHFTDKMGKRKSNHYYHQYPGFHHIFLSETFEKEMEPVRKLFSEITESLLDKHRKKTDFEQVMHFFLALKKSINDPIKISNSLPNVSAYQEQNARVLLFLGNASWFLKSVEQKDKDNFNKIMLDLLHVQGFATGSVNSKINNYVKLLALPDFLGGMCTKSVAEKTYSLAQNEGLRSEDYVVYFLKSFTENKKTISEALASHPPADFAPLLHLCLPMIGTGFADKNLSDQASALCKTMIDYGVPMEKVYARWTKHYSKDLQAGVEKWIILGAVDKKSRKNGKTLLQEKEEQSPKARRKM